MPILRVLVVLMLFMVVTTMPVMAVLMEAIFKTGTRTDWVQRPPH